jgi:hypothetical protein
MASGLALLPAIHRPAEAKGWKMAILAPLWQNRRKFVKQT